MKTHEAPESYGHYTIFGSNFSDRWASETPLDMNRVKSLFFVNRGPQMLTTSVVMVQFHFLVMFVTFDT